MNLDAARHARDRRLRKKLLFVLYASRGHSLSGYLSGRFLADQAASLVADGFESDEHAMQLVRDLRIAGLADEKPLGYVRRGEQPGLDHVQFAITDAGTRLQLEQSPPHPLVDDERIGGSL